MNIRMLLFWGMVFFWLLVPNTLLAGTFEIKPGATIRFTDPPSPWQVSTEPPAFLVSERAESLHPKQLAAARRAGLPTAEDAARRMLKDNELFLFNPQTRSHIEVDFSPLKQGERAANDHSLKTSARYTAEELSAEEGLKEVKTASAKTQIEGATSAYRVDASYRKLDQPTRFVGVITFALGNWIYLYYTAPQDAAEDHVTVNRWLESFKISKTE